MSSKTYVGRRLRSFTSAPEFDGFTRVVITVTDELEYSAGTETGRTLTLTCPWGTQAMANAILADIKDFKYRPYTASGAFLDPSSELGDGITVNGIYSGIYTLDTTFGVDCSADVSAPAEEEVDHEYPYIPKQERQVSRKIRGLTAELKVQAGLISAEVTARENDVEIITGALELHTDLISARVSKTGGSSSSFGWNLTDESWELSANNNTVFKATKSGIEVMGKVTALSGKIGGFDIEQNYLSYNGQTWNGDVRSGIYIGINGIQCGSEEEGVQITPDGRLYAEYGYFRGSVYAGNIEYGEKQGYFSGSGIAYGSIYGSSLVANTVSTSYTSRGINQSLGYADFANGVFGGINTATYVSAGTMTAGGLTVKNSFTCLGNDVVWRTIKDGNGLDQTVLVRSDN